jgi:hypothetical protein
MLKVRSICCVVLPMLALPASATMILESAGNFVVLGGSGNPGVTNSGSTTLTGYLGTYPNTSITGLSSIILNGTMAVGNAVAQRAQLDLTTAILGLDNLVGTSLSLSSYGAGTVTLSPGVYSTGSTFDLTGPLTLDFGNLSNAAFIFQVGSSLTAEVGSTVVLKNLGTNDGVFWVMGAGSATIDAGSTFEGNILANASITFGTGATDNCGSALAQTGDVTLLTNTLSTGCAGGVTITPPTLPGGAPQAVILGTSSVVPEPGTFLLLGTGLLGIGFSVRRKITS